MLRWAAARTLPVGLICLLFAFASLDAAAQDDEHTRGVRIIDNAGPSISTPLKPPPSVPTLTTPPTVVIAPPLTPSPPSGVSVPTANLTPQRPEVTPVPRTELPVGPIQAENSAGLSLQILPGDNLHVGEKITLRVSTKRAGYLLIVDIDAVGKVTQLYPNVRSLMMTPRNHDTANLIKPGQPVRIPNPLNLFAGFQLVASPPTGVAMVLAMLSDRPVQVVDLPDVPPAMVGQHRAVSFLQEVAQKLRISAAQGTSGLEPTHWSFDAKFYLIR